MRRLWIATSAIAIVAAACGSDTANPITVPGTAAPSNQAGAELETKGSITEAEVPEATAPPPVTEASPAQGSQTPTTSVTPEPAPPSDLPDVQLIDLATGGEFSVASLVPSDTPILLWFWAPH